MRTCSLAKIAEKVINENFEEVHEIMNKAFKTVVRSDGFELNIVQEFEHKVAKMLVGQLSGHVERLLLPFARIHELKQR